MAHHPGPVDKHLDTRVTAGLEKGSSTGHSNQPRPRVPTMWPPPVLSRCLLTNTVVGSKKEVAAIATGATLGAVRVQTKKRG